jgi:arylsulfatase A-like enzyme
MKLRILFFLTIFFCIFLVSLNLINHYINDLSAVIVDGVANNISILYKPLLFYFLAELLVGAVFIAVLWYVITAISECLNLNTWQTQALTILIWLLSIMTILLANSYYVPHSLFTPIFRSYYLNDALSNQQLKTLVIIASAGCLFVFMLAGFVAGVDLYRGRHVARHCSVLALALVLFLMVNSNNIFTAHTHGYANAGKPNIFIIGFDAINPEQLGFFNQGKSDTIHFDNFLNSAIVFSDAYTPSARTFPSWASVLSGKYPLHNKVREDNNASYPLKETLVTQFQQAGYKTIFASDDNRFSDINSEFGFQELIGDKGSVIDFLLCEINDFPLSNLLVPTKIGKLLFPYNYGNHAAAFTYDPNNFLELINDKIRADSRQPIFMAMHFNISAYPWAYFHDQNYQANNLERYTSTIKRADQVMGTLLANLKQQGYLQHAIVVLISDHGLTLAQPNDRNILENRYQGKTAARMLGKDKSFGYGSDILSLKQYRPLLAFKGYGVNLGPPHSVAGRSLFLDIAPTLLNLLNLPVLTAADGISLKPYLSAPRLNLGEQRPIYLESALSNGEITQDEISVSKMVVKNYNLFQIDSVTGLVSAKTTVQPIMLNKKQRGILQGDWLLAYYPTGSRSKLFQSASAMQYKKYLAPPFAVLLNIKTGAWTTEFDTSFAKNSPIKALSRQLHQFYGDEMACYASGINRVGLRE